VQPNTLGSNGGKQEILGNIRNRAYITGISLFFDSRVSGDNRGKQAITGATLPSNRMISDQNKNREGFYFPSSLFLGALN